MWFRRSKKVEPPALEEEEEDDDVHSVSLHYALADEFGTEEQREAVFALEDRLEQALDAAGAGEWEGHEFGGGEAVVILRGPDKDRLWAAVRAQATEFPFRPAYALVYDEDGAEPVRVAL